MVKIRFLVAISAMLILSPSVLFAEVLSDPPLAALFIDNPADDAGVIDDTANPETAYAIIDIKGARVAPVLEQLEFEWYAHPSETSPALQSTHIRVANFHKLE